LAAEEVLAEPSGAVGGRSVLPPAPPASQPPVLRFPPRPVVDHWPGATADRTQVLTLAESALAASPIHLARRRGLGLLLDWLGSQPGQYWQQRWLASGADAAGEAWAEGPAAWLRRQGKYSRSRLELMTSSLLVIVGADVVRPSLTWLLTGGKKRKLARNLIRSRDPEGFGQLHVVCERDPAVSADAEMHTVYRAAVIVAAKGGTLADITPGDVLEVLDLEIGVRGRAPSGSATFKMFREAGIFAPGVPTLAEVRSLPQRSVEELVDRYRIANRSIRDLLVDYLKERQPSIDYGTLRYQSYILAKCFWSDIEAHHPGIDSLALPREEAAAWKRRLGTKNSTAPASGGESVEMATERLSYLDVLAAVRAFYLDLSQWALDDPGRWGPWAAPCPVRPDELARRKAVRRRKARMDARTRERLPVLPVLVRSADQRRKETGALVAAGRQAAPGQEFTAAGQTTLIRSVRPHAAPANVWAKDPVTGGQRLLDREEEHAFWAWAIIEVLRLTGVRVEELTELSHHSLVRYRLPTTGELVPLLQMHPPRPTPNGSWS